MRWRYRLGTGFISRKNVLNLVLILTFGSSLTFFLKTHRASRLINNNSSNNAANSWSSSSSVFHAYSSKLFYQRRHPYNCKAIFDGDLQEISQSANASSLLLLSDNSDYELWKIFGDCYKVKRRFYYADKPTSDEEAAFPLAYNILINQDLLQTELLFNAIYSPQNTYCFHVDLKSAQVVNDGLRKFASCFPNVVIIPDERYPVTSDGVNMIRAFRSCLNVLLKSGRKWNYVFLLQGQDFPLRTNLELVKITKILNGSNDVELLTGYNDRLASRFKLTYDEHGLPLELNTKTAIDGGTTMAPVHGLTMYKGSVSAALSRKFVEMIITHEKAIDLVSYLDNALYTDEMYFATLNHNVDTFPVPGGYPGRCHSVGRKDWLSRFAMWNSYADAACSGNYRHSVCVFGTGDLFRLAKRPEMFLNKFSTRSVQPVATFCMHELLFNRTHFPGKYPAVSYGFNKTWYENSAAVAYQKWLIETPTKSPSEFTCVPCLFNCEH